jgi:dTMP kinase
MNKYICLEGMDGSGKTTAARYLATKYGATVISNPGGTRLTEALREILLHRTDIDIPALEAAAIFIAGSISTMRRCRELVDEGRRVILDRGFASTYAYQSADGCPLSSLMNLTNAVPAQIQPEITLFLDASPTVRAERLAAAGNRGKDRFESKGAEYFERVAVGYRRAAQLFSTLSINANRTVEEVADEIACTAGWKEALNHGEVKA